MEKEKAKLESDLKNADTKLFLLYEELVTLNSLEERDNAMYVKSQKCKADRAVIISQIRECQEKLQVSLFTGWGLLSFAGRTRTPLGVRSSVVYFVSLGRSPMIPP